MTMRASMWSGWTQIQRRHATHALSSDVSGQDAEQLHEALLVVFTYLLDRTTDSRFDWGAITLLAHDLYQLDRYCDLRTLDALLRCGANEAAIETATEAMLDRLARVRPYSPLYLPQSSSTVR